MTFDREIMGTPEDAKFALVEATRKWRELQQPLIASARDHRQREAQEQEALFRLGNAATLWLWHEENQ